MAVKCSIVVPVWNPGPNLARCLDSLLAQTMSARDYEIVLVDDGSTDGTADRIDQLAADHPGHIRVSHIPGSGWPGTPRNVGIDLARGEYIHFVDNDDMLPPYALKVMYDVALETNADVVLGRPASDFRGLDHRIYRRTLRRTTLAESPYLAGTLTPHKMFRRSLLIEHDIRFLEREPLEDQIFVMQAYLHAQSIAVLADRCYYHYLRRIGSGRNAGDAPVDTKAHFAALEKLLDMVDAAADADLIDIALRDTLLRRSYRISLLNPLYSAGMMHAPAERQQEMFDAIRQLAIGRFEPGVLAGCAPVHRILARLVDNDDVAGTLAFATRHRATVPRATAAVRVGSGGALSLAISGGLYNDDELVRCERLGDRWALPRWLAPTVPEEDRLLGADVGEATGRGGADDAGGGLVGSSGTGDLQDEADAEIVLVSRADAVAYGLGDGVDVVIDDDGAVRISGTATIDPGAALAGLPLVDGLWDVRLSVRFAGLSRSRAVAVSNPDELTSTVGASGRAVLPFVSGKGDALRLDVGQWHTTLAATVAPGCVLDAEGRRELRLTVTAAIAESIEVQVLLQPVDGTGGDHIACSGTLRDCSVQAVDGAGRTATAAATFRLPKSAPDGSWQPWLQLADSLAAPPAALPWLVHRASGQWRTTAVSPAV